MAGREREWEEAVEKHLQNMFKLLQEHYSALKMADQWITQLRSENETLSNRVKELESAYVEDKLLGKKND